jgi:hypothetical protein
MAQITDITPIRPPEHELRQGERPPEALAQTRCSARTGMVRMPAVLSAYFAKPVRRSLPPPAGRPNPGRRARYLRGATGVCGLKCSMRQRVSHAKSWSLGSARLNR